MSTTPSESTDPSDRSDADIGDFFARTARRSQLPADLVRAAHRPSARTIRSRTAAGKAAVTPTRRPWPTLDSLGRTFLTVAHNRFERGRRHRRGEVSDPRRLDIEGNQREVRDAIAQNGDRGRIVMRYDYDMLGNRIHQASMEAGERWMLNDVAGKPHPRLGQPRPPVPH